MIERRVKLWLSGGPFVRIPVSQFDTMWRFVFEIIHDSQPWEIPSGATAILNGKKPDGNVFAFAGTISNNTVTVDADVQMTACAGDTTCELSILADGKTVGTVNFTLAVEKAPKSPDDVSSESTLPAYGDMIEQAAELVGAAQDIIDQGPFLPSGGTTGQVLTKTSSGSTWANVDGLPEGGSNGQVLTRQGDGAEWSDAGTPTQAQTDSAVADWLDAHPEATTTVQDGSITEAKLATNIKEKIDGQFKLPEDGEDGQALVSNGNGGARWGGSTGSVLIDSHGQKWRLVVSTSGVLSTEKMIERKGTLVNVKNYEEPLLDGESFVATFVADDGYTLEGATVSVKMGGVDITNTAWDFGAIVIDEVSGDVEINIAAVKINYVVPTAADLTLQLYLGKQAIKAYTGTATAVELPTEIEVEGTVYQTTRWSPTFPNTVEHLKIVGIPPTYGQPGSLTPILPSGLKTFWGDGSFDVSIGASMERIPLPDKSGFASWNGSNYFTDQTIIRTARQLSWPQNATTGNTLFYGCKNLVDGGVVPERVTSIHAMFQNTTGKVRRLTVLSKTATGDPYAPASCVVSMYLDSALFLQLRENGTKLNALPKYKIKSLTSEKPKEILCIGDSLTAGVGTTNDYCYPAFLRDKVSQTTIVYNGGKGSTTSQWAVDRINSDPWDSRKKGSTYVVWTGTNGNGSADYTIETLKTKYQQVFASLPQSNVLLVPAVPAGGGYSRSAYDDLVDWCKSSFGVGHVFDVYAWFDGLGLTRSDFMSDSLHYNAAGYSIVSQGIFEKLSENEWLDTAYTSATALSVSQSTANLSAGATLQLSATTTPSGATGRPIWLSNNTSTATVSDAGLVTAVATGTAKIMCVVDAKVAVCEVTVV